ncbi:MAG: sulfatase-like hydrolase/transferase, partial [Blastocatellia bacterium]
DDGYLTEVTTREALSFIDRNKTEPFFLLVTHHAPHVPLEATRQYLDRVKGINDQGQRVYAAMVAALDDGVGAIAGKLDELKLAQDTFVVFLSDNGCASYVNGACTNAPLNGFKRDQLEGGVRVPMIVRYPSRLGRLGRLKAGQVFETPVISLDLMATALALGGADLKGGAALDGKDLLPYLTGKTQAGKTQAGKARGAPHDQLFWRAGENYAVREGDWKLWVVQSPKGGSETFLFNLKKDVGEQQNLAAQQPQLVARLKAAYATWNAGNIAPRFPPRTVDVKVNGVAVRLAF